MYPHERSLVKKMVDKPFALLGVNSDKDLEELKPVLEEEKITWRSFWNGEEGTRRADLRGVERPRLADAVRDRPQGGDPPQVGGSRREETTGRRHREAGRRRTAEGDDRRRSNGDVRSQQGPHGTRCVDVSPNPVTCSAAGPVDGWETCPPGPHIRGWSHAPSHVLMAPAIGPPRRPGPALRRGHLWRPPTPRPVPADTLPERPATRSTSRSASAPGRRRRTTR